MARWRRIKSTALCSPSPGTEASETITWTQKRHTIQRPPTITPMSVPVPQTTCHVHSRHSIYTRHVTCTTSTPIWFAVGRIPHLEPTPAFIRLQFVSDKPPQELCKSPHEGGAWCDDVGVKGIAPARRREYESQSVCKRVEEVSTRRNQSSTIHLLPFQRLTHTHTHTYMSNHAKRHPVSLYLNQHTLAHLVQGTPAQ